LVIRIALDTATGTRQETFAMRATDFETRQGYTLITRMNAVPQLGREEEQVLCRRYLADGDVAAKERVIASSMRHVVPLALRYRYYGVALPDLLAHGCMALATALDRFDPERGVRFATYASHWVRAELLAFVLKNRTLVGGGRGPLRPRFVFKMRREHQRIMSELGETREALEKLGACFNKTADEVSEILTRIEARDASLDARTSGEDGARGNLLDVLAAEDAEIEEHLERKTTTERMHGVLCEALAKLNARERFIIEQRVTADAEERLSLVDIGKRFGVSRERARQLESNALLKLRKQLSASGAIAA
jgi:RNA polymerase sigma-32 factor